MPLKKISMHIATGSIMVKIQCASTLCSENSMLMSPTDNYIKY